MKKYVSICPRCGSTNVKSIAISSPKEYAWHGAKSLGWEIYNPAKFICKDCDYYGICPKVTTDKIKNFKKKLKKG